MYMRTRYFHCGILLLALFAGCSVGFWREGDAPGGGSGDLYGYVRDAGSAIEVACPANAVTGHRR